MNDSRRIMRSKTRAVRRLVESRSCEEDETDTSTSDHNNGSPPTVRHAGGRCRGAGGYCSDSATYNHSTSRLPPIGVFWDIENCQIPRGKSAVAVAQVIRDQFFSGYRESEFVVVCDVKRETPQVIQELDNAQVNVIHVGSHSKNAADEKLRQSIRRFADIHGSSAAIVLISGDINFAPDLCDLKNRKKIHVILVHNDFSSESLLLCANETYRYSALVAGLPLRGAIKAVQPAEVTVSGLPGVYHDPGKVRARLKRLAENCGGRVSLVTGNLATVRFPSLEFAIRAQKRMDGVDVFGSQIVVSYPIIVSSHRPNNDLSPSKGFNRRTYTNGTSIEGRTFPSVYDESKGSWTSIPLFPNNSTKSPSNGKFKMSFPVTIFNNQENVPIYVNSKFNDSSSKNIQTQPLNARPILGRSNGLYISHEAKLNEGYSNGRHSLDSMLDFEVEREAHERDKESNATFENWLRNSTSNLVGYKSHDQSPMIALGVNTSIPPPPIVNLPRRNDRYFFHPINTSTNVTNEQPQSSPSPASSNDASESARCLLHGRVQSTDCSLAKVTMTLSDFSARLVALVTSHNNRLPLASLRDCYEAQFELMTSDSRSVALEHLVTCACSVELVKSTYGKYLRLTTNVSPTFSDPKSSEGLIAQFSKEMQDLLKNQPNCQLPFDQVIATYQRVYGRPCRMSAYGCSKLAQLLEKIPNIVQIMGEGPNRVITLTHRSQMQRFTADLTRVLRAQPSRQLTVHELPQQWVNILGCPLQPTEYGLCFLEDLIDLVPTSSAIVNGETIMLPRKLQQSAEEAQQINKLTLQVVDLLSTTANFTMEFSKFCPAFHQYFGTQCKLSDYGFAKLVELFEAIPHIVTIEGEMETGRRVSLTVPERLKVLSGRVLSLIQSRYPPGLYLDALLSAYLWQYGHTLRPEHFNCSSPQELLNKLSTVKVVSNVEGLPIIVPAISETGRTKDSQLNNSSQPKATEKEVNLEADKTKAGGSVPSSALLDLLKKAKNDSTVENGVNSTEPSNQLKPVAVQEPVVTLLSPAEFLLPPSNSKSPLTTSLFPSSPDPSVLPKPIGLTFSQVNGGFDIESKLLEDADLSEQNKCKQRLKLAPQFCSPLQLK